MKKHKNIVFKLLIAKKSIEYAAKDQEIIVPDMLVLDQADFPNDYITSMFISNKYLIVLSENWIKSAELIDVIMTSIHETRHAYQYSQIEALSKNLNIKEKIDTLIQWKIDFDNYKQPTSHEYEKQYVNQSIEEDAIQYSKRLIAIDQK